MASEVLSRTIRRILLKNDLYGRIARKKPLLTKKIINKPLAWCLEKRNWTQKKLNTVIYSDDCKLDLYSRHRKYVRRPPGKSFNSKYLLKTVKYSPNIMIWGAFRSDEKKMLIKRSNRVDSNEYRRIFYLALPEMYNSRFIFNKTVHHAIALKKQLIV